MSHFVSYILGKSQGKGKRRPVLFLTDNDVWNSKKGKEMVEANPCYFDYCGHGSIMYFYKLKNDNFKCVENCDFSNPKNFPKEIVKAIKEMKMVRISIGDNNWVALLGLLNEKAKQNITGIKMTNNLSFAKQLHIIKGQEKLGNEVKKKIIRIVKNKEAGFSGYATDSRNTIIKYFIWEKTEEGQKYWNNIQNIKLFEEDDFPSNINMKKYPKYEEMNCMIWKLFKDIKNRNPLWV